MLISEVGKSLKVYAFATTAESLGKDKVVSFKPLLMLPLDTLMCLLDHLNIVSLACCRLASLK